MAMEEHDREDEGEPRDLPDVDEDAPGTETPPSVAAALGQLALAVLVVVVLIVIFMGSSAVLRRLLG
jgi:hypothetical protein